MSFHDDAINSFCATMHFSVEKPEEHHWVITDNLELYSPDHPESAGKWELFVGRVIPGVRYTSNGDGWPDDYELTLHGSYDDLNKALTEIGTIYVQEAAYNAIYDAALAQDYEETSE